MKRTVCIETTVPSFFVEAPRYDLGLFVPIVTTPDLLFREEADDV